MGWDQVAGGRHTVAAVQTSGIGHGGTGTPCNKRPKIQRWSIKPEVVKASTLIGYSTETVPTPQPGTVRNEMEHSQWVLPRELFDRVKVLLHCS